MARCLTLVLEARRPSIRYDREVEQSIEEYSRERKIRNHTESGTPEVEAPAHQIVLTRPLVLPTDRLKSTK